MFNLLTDDDDLKRSKPHGSFKVSILYDDLGKFIQMYTKGNFLLLKNKNVCQIPIFKDNQLFNFNQINVKLIHGHFYYY